MGGCAVANNYSILYDSHRITKVNFKYSQRLQRESCKDDVGNLQPYMRSNYEHNKIINIYFYVLKIILE